MAAHSEAPGGAIVFFDGDCGLCHRAVRWLVALDRRGRLRYAPLGGPTFEARIEAGVRSRLPDSLVFLAEDGSVAVRSAGMLRALARTGGFGAAAARIVGWLPAGPLDRLYDAIAASRGRLFARPKNSCPVVPPPLRDRFLA